MYTSTEECVEMNWKGPFLNENLIINGFVAGRTNVTEWCAMPTSCKVYGFTDWYEVGSHCVKYFKRPRSFSAAELKCRATAPGAHLVSVHSKRHNDYLLCMAKKFNRNNLRFWLGAFELFKSGVFLWTDGSFWDFQIWTRGEPNHMYTSTEECVEMNWKGPFLNEHLIINGKPGPFLNEHLIINGKPGFVAGRTNVTESCAMPTSCKVYSFTDWYEVGSYCVKYFNRPLNFTAAEFKCRATAPGAHLVSVHSKKHNDYLLCMVQNFNPNNLRFWLGAFELFQSGTFLWTDGSFWDFQIWNRGEPNHLYTRINECVEMISKGPFLNENLIINGKPGFVAGRTNVTESCVMPKSCKVYGFTDWYNVGSHCVKYFKWPLKFAAEFKCRATAPGAHLVSVHSKKHNDYLLCMVQKFNPNNLRFWLGAFELFKDFQIWTRGEPNHMYTSTEECVEMNWKETGKWNDASCHVKKSYICAFKWDAVLKRGFEKME
ncbi:lectin-like protein [Labeo rohita]|uniref:Lectin-like protein n=1 Tax=Labeo rohita TaxID=84645 RepID=A0A498MG28_LABRO|nr:lectin-like protein [Labeo rohita]